MATAKDTPKRTTKQEALADTGRAGRSEPRSHIVSGWDPERIRSAEVACSMGDWTLAADLCETMFAHPRVAKCLARLCASMTLPMTFLLPGMDAKASKDNPICQALEEDWWKLLPEEQAQTCAKWLGLFGTALGHIDGYKSDKVTGRVVPVIKFWSPKHVRHDPGLGWRVKVASSPGDATGNEEPLVPGDGEWILFLMGASYRAPYHAPWRGVARLWYLSNIATVDWADSSHRHGNGLGVAESTQVDKIKVDAKSRQELARDIKALVRNGVLVLPPGYTYKIISDTANTWTTFKAQMEVSDLGIDMGLTGTNLTSEVKGGSYAAASVHASLDSVRMSSFLELISTGAHDQILPGWASLNFATDLVPYPHWDTAPPEDKKATAEAKLADASAFEKYVNSGAEIDQLAWFNEGVVKLRPGATAEVKRPEPPAPAVVQQPPAPAPPAKPAKASVLSLDTSESPCERGIGYVEKVEGACVGHMAKALIPVVARVTAAISEATDFDDAYRRVTEAYGKAPTPTEMVTFVDRALIMTQLAGIETVEQEDGTEG